MRPAGSRARSIALAAAILAGSALSVSAGPGDDLPLPERIDRALRDMMDDVKPSLEGALDYMRSFGAIDDPRNYELPELLPNGDIIIRRRDDAPEFRPDYPDGEPDAPGAPPADDPPYDPGDGVRT